MMVARHEMPGMCHPEARPVGSAKDTKTMIQKIFTQSRKGKAGIIRRLHRLWLGVWYVIQMKTLFVKPRFSSVPESKG
jgi:hypothetical protein